VVTVVCNADITKHMEHKEGGMHWVLPLDNDYKPWAWVIHVRMVRPWKRWLIEFLPSPFVDAADPILQATEQDYVEEIKKVMGDETLDVEILHVGSWQLKTLLAPRYSEGNAYCLGDAVHIHPPFNGLGSATCMQDAFNLAWKIAYVLDGRAGPKLLSTYNTERQPVGADVVERAGLGLPDSMGWLAALGVVEPDPQKRKEIIQEFEDTGEKGRNKRLDFQKGIAKSVSEFSGLGIEMNQQYSSDAVYRADETQPPPEFENKILKYQISTYPGFRLPHAWLNTRIPGKPISTIDLAGHGQFCLLTGPGGQSWKDAAEAVSKSIGVEIKAYSIGWKQDYEDVYFDWARLREVEDNGCILARPDRFVAWRSPEIVADCNGKLEQVMKSVLCLD